MGREASTSPPLPVREVLMTWRYGYLPAPFVILALFAMLAVALGGSGGGLAQEGSPEASPSACPEASPSARSDASPVASPAASPAADGTPCPEGTPGGSEVEVKSYDIYFEPKEVTIPADTDVTFILPNEGVTLHNFSIDELGIDVDIEPGATEETIINAPAGEYEYYCNVPGHREAGMVGTLIVE
jgi:plastocyanin